MRRKKVEKLQKQCQICSKSAVGFHYGAYVCEACKKFFVRHATGSCRAYRNCPEEGNCNLKMDGRGKCQHCRYQRCISVGMSINYKDIVFDLTSIPCQVCSAKSSGLHFGCITCEGCKGFFRRMAKFKGLLVCFSKNECELDYKQRGMCKSCRLKRCLEIGMSRKGIRIGRHPNFLKQRYVNQAEAEALASTLVPKAGVAGTSSVATSTTTEMQDMLDDGTMGVVGSAAADAACRSSGVMDSDDEDEDENIGEGKDEDDNETETEMDDIIMDTNVDEDKNEKRKEEKENEKMTEEDEEFSNVNIEPESSVNTCYTSPEIVENEPESQKADTKENENNDDFEIGNLEQIITILSSASAFLSQRIDTECMKDTLTRDDEPADQVWAVMMDHFIYHSQFIVKFAKLIPGFSKLTLNDKKTMIKFSIYPLILLELSQDYRVEGNSHFNYFDFSLHDRLVILDYFPEFVNFSSHLQYIGSIINEFRFGSMGLALLCGIMMFYNFEHLENWLLGKSMRLLYQQCLISYFQLGMQLPNHESQELMDKCLELITVLNNMNSEHHTIIANFCLNHQELQYPDLYIEVFKS